MPTNWLKSWIVQLLTLTYETQYLLGEGYKVAGILYDLHQNKLGKYPHLKTESHDKNFYNIFATEWW